MNVYIFCALPTLLVNHRDRCHPARYNLVRLLSAGTSTG